MFGNVMISLRYALRLRVCLSIVFVMLAGTATAQQATTPQVATPKVTTQQAHVKVGENVLVGREPQGTVLIEPHVAAHPTDPRRLLAVGWVHGAGETNETTDAEHCAVFSSSDGGASWSREDVPGKSCLDPWLTFTAKGALLTAMGSHPSLPEKEGHNQNQLMAYYSPDGGDSWIDVPQPLGLSHDGPRSIASGDGAIYLVSSQATRDTESQSRRFGIFLARAAPGRAYLDTLPRIFPSNLNLQPDALTVLSDGTLVFTYQDFQRNVNNFIGRGGRLERRRTWAIRASERGTRLSIPLFITESCFDRPTSIAADTSKAFPDRLYQVCSGADQKSVLLTISSNRGEEWTEPKPIEPPTTKEGARALSQVVVNGQGTVAVAWMDRRDDPTGRCYAPYVVASVDGGQTFSNPVRVANAVSCPDAAKTGAFVARRWAMGGDYLGLTAGADGRFHLVWSDARDGAFQIWTAAVSVQSGTEK